MSSREKILLAVVLALFAIAHVAGAFMMGGAHATQEAPAALTYQGD
jgi:flagellar basal body-associated protein FliL